MHTQILVGTHEANKLLAATVRHRMKAIIKTGLAGGRGSGMVADGWTEALKNTGTNVTVRQEPNNLLTILSASQDPIALVGLDDGHFYRSSMQTGLKVGQGQHPPFFSQQRDTTKALGTRHETYGC
jgi:hypothetical protein